MLLRNLHLWGKICIPRNGLYIVPMVVIKLILKYFFGKINFFFFFSFSQDYKWRFISLSCAVQSYYVQLNSFSKRPISGGSGHLHSHWDYRCTQKKEFLVWFPPKEIYCTKVFCSQRQEGNIGDELQNQATVFDQCKWDFMCLPLSALPIPFYSAPIEICATLPSKALTHNCTCSEKILGLISVPLLTQNLFMR